jgi:hypothetical protein
VSVHRKRGWEAGEPARKVSVTAVTRRPGSTHRPPLTAVDLPPVELARDHPGTPRAGVRSGDLVAVRRGAFVRIPDLPMDPYERDRVVHLARLVATSRQLGPGVVLSHTSAALLWGLPRVGGSAPHVTQATRPSGCVARDVVRHVHRLTNAEITHVAGLRTTTLRRTALDCATACRGTDAVVLLDAALRAGATREGLEDALAGWRGRRGVRQARELLELADDGAESAGESLARAAVLAIGLPRPETQVEVSTAEGTVWGDLGWEEWHLLLEYDGTGKYRGGGHEALLREKRREDLIRECGWRVVRLGAADLRDPHRMLARLARHVPDAALRALSPRPWLLSHPSRATTSHR